MIDAAYFWNPGEDEHAITPEGAMIETEISFGVRCPDCHAPLDLQRAQRIVIRNDKPVNVCYPRCERGEKAKGPAVRVR